ncbi:DUF2382 domain-containing protein (plasmid) [Paraburkholderia sp. FT54]|uniref:DUF2382 domain-containing protein n=1 Tax=Paraburkholderia sp. FT54 TaxID=3074437 RepID=UPI002877F607|nr:DUF2382 domain-containing protein [Paraburkholderia sp. FT54]WNC95514.1 DUF2382 domain-containing protein [Paraburkholderia sp. FT54]
MAFGFPLGACFFGRRPVARPARPRPEGECVEVRETGERPVVSKAARVVGEVVVGKEATKRRNHQRHGAGHADRS